MQVIDISQWTSLSADVLLSVVLPSRQCELLCAQLRAPNWWSWSVVSWHFLLSLLSGQPHRTFVFIHFTRKGPWNIRMWLSEMRRHTYSQQFWPTDHSDWRTYSSVASACFWIQFCFWIECIWHLASWVVVGHRWPQWLKFDNSTQCKIKTIARIL